jgi:uncharacterized membrane protein
MSKPAAAESKWGFRPEWAVMIAMLFYAIYFAAFGAQRYFTFQSSGYDLSFYTQSLWNTLHGEFFRLTVQPITPNFFSVYFTPSVLLLTPLYALWPSPVCLFLVQSAAAASGAWPIMLLARERLQSPWLAAGYAVIYLLYPALQAATLFDFHGITLAAPCLIWAWYLARRRRWAAYSVMAVLAAGFREEIVAAIFIIGLLLIFDSTTRRVGGWTMVGAAAWAASLAFVAVPLVAPQGSLTGVSGSRFAYLANVPEVYLWPGRVLVEATRPDKIAYLLHLFAPAGYLSLFDPLTLLPALPTLLANLVSAYPPAYSPIRFQYSAPLPAFIVLAAVGGNSRLAGWIGSRQVRSKRFAQRVLFAFTLFLSLGYQLKLSNLPFSPDFRWPLVTAHHRLGWQIAQSIPPDATVCAQNQLAPHVSNRRTMHIFPYFVNDDYVFLDSTLIAFVSYDARDAEQVEQAKEQLLVDPRYTVVFQQDGYLLLKRTGD